MLYTDGTPASLEDLRRFDNSCEELAKDSNVSLKDKLQEAADEMGGEILSFLLFQGAPDNQLVRQRTGLKDVVVTSTLRRWHAIKALAGLYRDACGTEVTERFEKKWKEFERMAKDAAERAFTTGIGLARTPVAQAPVADVAQTGSPSLRTGRTIQITWVAADGTEGSASPAYCIDASPGDVVPAPWPVPNGVTGWNVYVGIGDGTPLLQNERPMSVDASWTIPATLNTGRSVRDGQDPDFYVVERRIIPRG
jgi:hypothetical protein